MKTYKHTPGPWITTGERVWGTGANTDIQVAHCHEPALTKDEIMANAALIAAAPETAVERDALRAQVARLRALLSDACDELENPPEPIVVMQSVADYRSALADVPEPDNTCPTCNGGGRATESVEDERPCPTCKGTCTVKPDINAEMLKALREGEEIISGLEAQADNAGINLSEARNWWANVASPIIAKAMKAR